MPLLAQSPNQLSANNSLGAKIRFIPAQSNPPDRGTPPTNEGTGSRGDCLAKKNKPPHSSLEKIWIELLSAENVNLSAIVREPIVGGVSEN
ncbi:hypothetical protein NUACC21_70500 [Scytonema sp. NUACC21]